MGAACLGFPFTRLPSLFPVALYGVHFAMNNSHYKKMSMSKYTGYIQCKDASWHEKFYFFYGTLMDPSTLTNVLGHFRPETCPAFITGYSMKLWGQYPALVNEATNQRISGCAYNVTSKTEADRLAAYETSMYRTSECTIYFEDGSQAAGVTFVWGSHLSLLREGTFDLKDWLMQKKEDSIMAGDGPSI